MFRRKSDLDISIDLELAQMKAGLNREQQERLRIQNHLILQGFSLQEAQDAYESMMGNHPVWAELPVV